MVKTFKQYINISESVKFTARGNGYHDVHLHGKHASHLEIMLDTSVNTGGGRRETLRTYTLYNKNKQKRVTSGSLNQIKRRLEDVVNKKK